MTPQEVIERNAVLAPFDEVAAAIEQYKEENEKLVFDYEDEQGNKEARSHIFSLRKVKTRIAEIHKEAKAEALAIGRAIDAEKKKHTTAVEEMINVHLTPIKAIEQREEEERQRKLDEIKARQETEEQARLDAIKKQEEELAAKEAELKAKEDAIAAKQAEQERIERERQIADEAERRAKEEAAQAIKDAEERRQRELKEAEEKRIADLKAAEEKAKMEQAAREAAEQRRIAEEKAEQERLAEIERQRVSNEKHRAKIEAEVIEIFIEYGLSKKKAAELTSEIKRGLYPVLSINY